MFVVKLKNVFGTNNRGLKGLVMKKILSFLGECVKNLAKLGFYLLTAVTGALGSSIESGGVAKLCGIVICFGFVFILNFVGGFNPATIAATVLVLIMTLISWILSKNCVAEWYFKLVDAMG